MTKAITIIEVLKLELEAQHLREHAQEVEVTFQAADTAADNAEHEARKARAAYISEHAARELAAAYAAHPEALPENLPMTELTKSQTRKFEVQYKEGGRTYRLTAKVRYDDECGNGHNTFAITGDLDSQARPGAWREEAGGCLHEDITKHFGGLRDLIKWHLVSSDGPMHYLANTVYHVEQGNLDFARGSAVWPNATDEELKAPGLRGRLLARLPQLMLDFQAAVKSLGFVY